MKLHHFCCRLFICCSVILSTCHPGIQLSAVQNEITESSPIRGQLANGTPYTILTSELSVEEVQKIVDLINHPDFNLALESENTNDKGFLNNLLEKVEPSSDGEFLLVDGKILMNQPNWINKSINGKALGALLTVLGIGGMVIAAPIALAIAGGISTGTGLYFLFSGYMKDPSYLESIRKTDLESGFVYAYNKGRAGLTLTPYERRALFLQEMIDTPHLLPQLPILLLANLFQLNDPVVAEIFTVDEFNVLTRIKRDFIQQRNDYKMLKVNLDQELAALTAPYAMARDTSLKLALDVYNQNYYVISKATLQLQRDASIADIEKAYKAHDITLDEKEMLIKKALEYFEISLSSPDLQKGLNGANMNYAHSELDIHGIYNYQVEVAKQTIHFNQRMDYFLQGENSLINYYNHELRNLLITFPVYHVIFPDYIDLRNHHG